MSLNPPISSHQHSADNPVSVAHITVTGVRNLHTKYSRKTQRQGGIQGVQGGISLSYIAHDPFVVGALCGSTVCTISYLEQVQHSTVGARIGFTNLGLEEQRQRLEHKEVDASSKRNWENTATSNNLPQPSSKNRNTRQGLI